MSEFFLTFSGMELLMMNMSAEGKLTVLDSVMSLNKLKPKTVSQLCNLYLACPFSPSCIYQKLMQGNKKP